MVKGQFQGEASAPGSSLQAVADGRSQVLRFIPMGLLLVILIVLSVLVPYFLSLKNFISILMQSSALGLMAVGLTAVLITGGIDLSIPSLMSFSAVLGAMYMKAGGNPVVASILMLVVATAGGSVNGLAVAYLKMIPFVVTLSTMAVFGGASIWITNAVSVTGIPRSFITTVMSDIGIFPVPVVAFLVVTLIVQLFLSRSLHGRWLYAVGTNIRAARVSGIPAQRVLFGAYVFSGFIAGLAAIVTTAWLGTAGGTIGSEGVVLDVVSSAVLGGVSIYGGAGTAIGALIGTILIKLISNSLNFLQASYYMTLVVKGIVIVAFVAIDSLFRRST